MLLQAPETSLDFVQLWIRTGILAQFVAKAFAANLAVSLLAFVDPLSMYGGKYEAPKSALTTEQEIADGSATLQKQASDARGAGESTALSLSHSFPHTHMKSPCAEQPRP